MRSAPRSVLRLALLLPPVLAGLLSACDKTGAYGDATSIVTAADPELWTEIEEDVEAILEPTVQTVRDERAFTVTYQSPGDTLWFRLRQFKQLLLIGAPREPWLEEALDRVRGRDDFAPPEIVQARDVWARGQTVTLALLPEVGDAQAARGLLPELQRIYDSQFRQLAVARMFVSGRDEALRDSLRQTAGFELLVPSVYQWEVQDSVHLFRNDNPDPAELIRQVAVTWRSPIPDDVESLLQADSLLAWRQGVAAAHYSEPQLVDTSAVSTGPVAAEGQDGVELQAVWNNTPEADWPAAGPFILRAIRCPAQDRLYLVDAWLYAPGREKYEYMIQLQTILDSFGCGD